MEIGLLAPQRSLFVPSVICLRSCCRLSVTSGCPNRQRSGPDAFAARHDLFETPRNPRRIANPQTDQTTPEIIRCAYCDTNVLSGDIENHLDLCRRRLQKHSLTQRQKNREMVANGENIDWVPSSVQTQKKKRRTARRKLPYKDALRRAVLRRDQKAVELLLDDQIGFNTFIEVDLGLDPKLFATNVADEIREEIDELATRGSTIVHWVIQRDSKTGARITLSSFPDYADAVKLKAELEDIDKKRPSSEVAVDIRSGDEWLCYLVEGAKNRVIRDHELAKKDSGTDKTKSRYELNAEALAQSCSSSDSDESDGDEATSDFMIFSPQLQPEAAGFDQDTDRKYLQAVLEAAGIPKKYRRPCYEYWLNHATKEHIGEAAYKFIYRIEANVKGGMTGNHRGGGKGDH